jgi:hypothetical protein
MTQDTIRTLQQQIAAAQCHTAALKLAAGTTPSTGPPSEKQLELLISPQQ